MYAAFMDRIQRLAGRTDDVFDYPFTMTNEAVVPSSPSLSKNNDNDANQHDNSGLYALAKSWAWESTMQRCKTHPSEVSSGEVDQNGDTMLHWVSFGNPPVSVVDALLNADPSLARMANREGNLPLHVACSYRASAAVINSILAAYPEAGAIPDRFGAYALHTVCDYGCSSVESLRILLKYPLVRATALEKERNYQRKPLYLLNMRRNMREFYDHLIRARLLRHKQRILRDQRPVMDTKQWNEYEETLTGYRQSDFWQKASLLLVAEVNAHLEPAQIDDTTILHACGANVDCPHTLREFGMLLHADKLLCPDPCHGNLFLHTIIAQQQQHQQSDFLQEVLKLEPECAKVPNADGVLPLLLALQHMPYLRWNTGMGPLLEAFPPALEETDVEHSEIPHVWTRISSPTALFLAVQSRVAMFERRPHEYESN